ACVKASILGLSRRSDHSTRGGSSESALNELAVRPTGAPSAPRQVTIVTPVTKRPSASRSSSGPSSEGLSSAACLSWVNAAPPGLACGGTGRAEERQGGSWRIGAGQGGERRVVGGRRRIGVARIVACRGGRLDRHG